MSVSARMYKQRRSLPAHRPLPWGEYVRQVAGKDAVLWIALALAAASSVLVRPPAGAYAEYIDVKTLACLATLMAASGGFMLSGVFDLAAARLAERAGNARTLTRAMVRATFFASMLITNDVALIVFVPMTLLAFASAGRDPTATVVLQTVAANAGSMMLPIGNPQNLYLFSWYGMPAPIFLAAVWPLSLAGLVFLELACRGVAPDELRRPMPLSARLARGEIGVYAGLFFLAILGVFGILPYGFALAAAAGVMVWKGRALIQQVDYALLLTFVGFFVFVGNLSRLDGIAVMLRGLVEPQPYLAAVLSSQVLSNVPAAVLLSRFTEDGTALLAGVNAGGCGTLIASMASLISYKLHVRNGGGRKRFLILFTGANVAALAAMTAAYYFSN